MSIYNGFSTWRLETSYLKTLYKMIVMIQKELVVQVQRDNEQFSAFSNENSKLASFEPKFKKLLDSLVTLEDVKYQPPWFSTAFEPLAKFFKLPFEWRES